MLSIQKIINKNKNLIDLLDLELLLAHSINQPREFILTHPEYQLNPTQIKKLKKLIQARKENQPLAYIVGRKEFYSLSFKVNSNVLIPRPETEMLVDLVLDYLQLHPQKNFNLIDVGTGSGNIIISLVKNILSEKKLNINNYHFYALDESPSALKIARKNSLQHQVYSLITFLKSDLLEKMKTNPKIISKPNIIIANLPYLSDKIYSNSASDVKNYEPKLALLSQQEGLEHYQKLLKQIKKNFNQKYLIVLLEFSPEQKEKLKKIILRYFPLAKINFYKDLNQKWRSIKIVNNKIRP